MRNQCLRLLLLRCHAQSPPHISQVHLLSSFSPALFHSRAPHFTPKPSFPFRHFTSSPPNNPSSDQAVLLADIFSNPEKSNDEIKLDLDSNNVILTHDLILSVLRKPETSPDLAKKVFNWVLDCESSKLSSKSYNYMLGILGSNGLVKESWDLIRVMKEKGYGLHKGTFVRISERFEKDGFSDEVRKLKELYASGSVSSKKDDLVEMVCSRISGRVWGDELEKELKDLNVHFRSDLVTKVLERLEMDPNKALIFFRWVEESYLFKHDEHSYNAMVLVLSREEFSEKFWRFVNEMRGKGHEMKKETYVKLLGVCIKRKAIKDAVDLYEFAMIGENKPSVHDCTLLLKKIVVSKELDMDLFLKVVRIFRASGNSLTDANMDAVFKSLTSVGKLTECNKILKAMEKEGYVPSVPSQCKIAYKLSSGGKTSEAIDFKENMIASLGDDSDYKPWISFIKGFCEARDLDEASNSFKEMVATIGDSCAGYALNMLVSTYCIKNRPLDAYKLVLVMVLDKGLTPRRITYTTLTNKLLAKKRFEEALNVMRMMKNQGYAQDSDAFVEYLSKTGSAENAVSYTQAMSSKRFPSTSQFIRLFKAYMKAGRVNEAQEFLSKCPSYIRDHADVLDLFCSVKSEGAVRTRTAAVAV